MFDIRDRQSQQGLVERDGESGGVGLVTYQLLAEIVPGVSDLQPSPALRRLEHMGFDAELNPRGRVAPGIERLALHLLENRVVLASVPAEIRLDGDQLGPKKPFLREHQRLDYASQPSVTVAKRMDGDEVQMSH